MNGVAAIAVYCSLLALLVLGVILRPSVALAAVAGIFGLTQWGQSTNDWLAAHTPVTNIAVGILVLAAIGISVGRGRCVACRIPGVTWLVVGLFVYAWVTLQWTPRPDLANPLWREAYPYLLTFEILVPLVIDTFEDFRAALQWLLFVGGCLVLALLVFGHWGVRGLILGAITSDNETNPLALAGLGGCLASTAMFLQLKRAGFLGYALRLAVAAASLILILRSGSRGQLFSAVAAILLMLPVAHRFVSIRGLATAVAGMAVIGTSLYFGYRDFVVAHGDAERWGAAASAEATTGRLAMIDALLSAWSRSAGSIMFGLGNSAAWDPSIIGIYPHNVPAEVLCEEGIVGFALYGMILIIGFVSLGRAIITTRHSPHDRCVVAAVGSSYLFFFLISLKQGNMIGSIEFFMYSILLARMAHSLSIEVTQSSVKTEVSSRANLYPNLLS